jgi:UDP-N-acetylglucosamine--N-acetylmuramyl-(pentapeptide) pyrophosphoryl-undecaprenol N-acetylglucosamine transferase
MIWVSDFISNMNDAYSAADIIISRAGGTISELAIIGKPTILMPSPNVADDHQTSNVIDLVNKHAAVLVKDEDAVKTLGDEILRIFTDSQLYDELSKNIKSIAKPNATEDIANDIIKSLNLTNL